MITSAGSMEGPFIVSAGSMEGPFIVSFLAKGCLTRAQVELLSIDSASKMATYAGGTADGAFGTLARPRLCLQT
jgi:NitT/TauT family transport system substrate-binding protein